MSSNELGDYHVQHIDSPTFPDLSRWGPDSVSLLGWKGGRRICACFSKSRYSVKKLYLHLREIREEKGCFWDAPCQPNFLCLGGSLLRFSAFNTGTVKYPHNCFSFTSQSPPYYMNQTSRPYSECLCQRVSLPRLHDVSTLRMWSLVLVKQYYFIVQEHGCANSSSCKPHGPQLCL